MLNAETNGEEIHLFRHACHHSDFTHCGRLKVSPHVRRSDVLSRFNFTGIWMSWP